MNLSIFIKQYKSFTKKPSEFKYLYNSDSSVIGSDSDSYSSSSSDDFPSPGTPRRKTKDVRNEKDYDNLYSRIRDMQRRLYTIELKNKKEVKR